MDKEEKDKCCCGLVSDVEGRIKERSDDDAYCTDILIQVSAISAALNSFNKELLARHIRTCVATDIREGRDDSMEDLLKTIQKLMK